MAHRAVPGNPSANTNLTGCRAGTAGAVVARETNSIRGNETANSASVTVGATQALRIVGQEGKVGEGSDGAPRRIRASTNGAVAALGARDGLLSGGAVVSGLASWAHNRTLGGGAGTLGASLGRCCSVGAIGTNGAISTTATSEIAGVASLVFTASGAEESTDARSCGLREASSFAILTAIARETRTSEILATCSRVVCTGWAPQREGCSRRAVVTDRAHLTAKLILGEGLIGSS